MHRLLVLPGGWHYLLMNVIAPIVEQINKDRGRFSDRLTS